MARLNVTLSAAVVVLSTAVVCVADATAQVTPPRSTPVLQTASISLPGGITGTVIDERGAGLPGAMVSVLGAAMAMDVTDEHGRFTLTQLPAGEYVLRAHMQGFIASPREIVRIAGTGVASHHRIQLRRVGAPAPASASTLASRPILSAGFSLPQVAESEPDAESGDAKAGKKEDHPHGEVAWRMRHLPRSILKNASDVVAAAEDETPALEPYFGNTRNAGLSTALVSSLPFSGEVNLLTTSAYAPGSFFSGDHLPRSVAYIALGAPAGPGQWSVRAATSQGDLASWLLAGAYAAKPGAAHAFEVGLSFSKQNYHVGDPLTLAVVPDASRTVAEVYGVDRWRVVSGVSFEYGGHFARYGYLATPDFFSPRVGLTLEPTHATRVSVLFAQRMVAPGAEEFLSGGTLGPWLPPERTFSPLPGQDLRVERARNLDFGVEHDFGDSYVVGVRRFFDIVDDQFVTMFGFGVPGGPQSAGHYYVANAGNVDAEGWGFRFSGPAGKRVRGTIDYSLARARWSNREQAFMLAGWVPAAMRPESERIQDITTTVHTNIPETATRVFVLYKVNTAFTRSDVSLLQAGLDGRFDLQVNQALPFGVAGTQWEVLFGLRNLFRDPADAASFYDELLVVRPPKRVVGGFLVKF